jgi:hypothetical protein
LAAAKLVKMSLMIANAVRATKAAMIARRVAIAERRLAYLRRKCPVGRTPSSMGERDHP